MALSHYERLSASIRIAEYYWGPGQPPSDADFDAARPLAEGFFKAAKEEALVHMRRALAAVEEITFEEFMYGRNGR
jgi:hypothetical protein